MSVPPANVTDPAYSSTAAHPSKFNDAKATAHATVEHGKASVNQLSN